MNDRLKSLLELYKKEPDDSFVAYGIALEFISLKDYNKAESYLISLLDKNPDFVPAFLQLAQVEENLDKINDLRTVAEIKECLNELR